MRNLTPGPFPTREGEPEQGGRSASLGAGLHSMGRSTVTETAAALGVTRTTLSELVNEKRGISPEMAVRLSQVFGGSAESWLAQQAQYDLAQVRTDRIRLKRLVLA
jgi:antitoxin HigA-1